MALSCKEYFSGFFGILLDTLYIKAGPNRIRSPVFSSRLDGPFEKSKLWQCTVLLYIPTWKKEDKSGNWRKSPQLRNGKLIYFQGHKKDQHFSKCCVRKPLSLKPEKVSTFCLVLSWNDSTVQLQQYKLYSLILCAINNSMVCVLYHILYE